MKEEVERLKFYDSIQDPVLRKAIQEEDRSADAFLGRMIMWACIAAVPVSIVMWICGFR